MIKEFGCIGRKLGHSFSKEIHNALSDYEYELLELSEEELQILHLYRRARTMPQPMREALRGTLETTINMYISSYQAVKAKRQQRSKTQHG